MLLRLPRVSNTSTQKYKLFVSSADGPFLIRALPGKSLNDIMFVDDVINWLERERQECLLCWYVMMARYS